MARAFSRENTPSFDKELSFPLEELAGLKNNPFVWSQYPSPKHIIIVVIYYIKKQHLIKIKLGGLRSQSHHCLVLFFTSPSLTQSSRRLI